MPDSITLGPNGKDKIILVTKADHSSRSCVVLEEPEKKPGLILPNGEINWMCPCLDGMATGPCGVQFRDAFSCFHHSMATPQGNDCLGLFQALQECMQQHPQTYIKQDIPPNPVKKKVCAPQRSSNG